MEKTGKNSIKIHFALALIGCGMEISFLKKEKKKGLM